jgi:predicted site-specific integrase-resolvase
VEHPERLARFGTNYLSVLLARSGVKLEIVNLAKDEKRELVDDLISIITSFSAKLYGQRRSWRKTEKIIKELEDATD